MNGTYTVSPNTHFLESMVEVKNKRCTTLIIEGRIYDLKWNSNSVKVKRNADDLSIFRWFTESIPRVCCGSEELRQRGWNNSTTRAKQMELQLTDMLQLPAPMPVTHQVTAKVDTSTSLTPTTTTVTAVIQPTTTTTEQTSTENAARLTEEAAAAAETLAKTLQSSMINLELNNITSTLSALKSIDFALAFNNQEEIAEKYLLQMQLIKNVITTQLNKFKNQLEELHQNETPTDEQIEYVVNALATLHLQITEFQQIHEKSKEIIEQLYKIATSTTSTHVSCALMERIYKICDATFAYANSLIINTSSCSNHNHSALLKKQETIINQLIQHDKQCAKLLTPLPGSSKENAMCKTICQSQTALSDEFVKLLEDPNAEWVDIDAMLKKFSIARKNFQEHLQISTSISTFLRATNTNPYGMQTQLDALGNLRTGLIQNPVLSDSSAFQTIETQTNDLIRTVELGRFIAIFFEHEIQGDRGIKSKGYLWNSHHYSKEKMTQIKSLTALEETCKNSEKLSDKNLSEIQTEAIALMEKIKS